MKKIVRDSETSFLEKLESIPDGTWRTRAYEEGSQVGDTELHQINLQLEKEGNTLTFKNEGTDENIGAINCTYAGFRTCLSCAINPLMMHDQLWVPSGAYRNIDIQTEPETISRASHPSAVSCGSNIGGIMQISLIFDVLTRMLITSEETRDDIIVDPSSGMTSLSQAGIDQWGNPFGTMNMDLMAVGMGARATKDGIDVAGYAYAPKGATPNTEQNERDYPMLYLYRGNAEDYGGPGENRGGVSMKTAWKPHNTEAIQTVAAGTGGVKPNTSPMAGYPGTPARARSVEGSDFESFVERAEMPTRLDEFEKEPTEYHTKSEFVQSSSDVVENISPGSGGYGDPLHRDPEKVRKDVVNGFVSRESAREFYGVVLRETGRELVVDHDATEMKREDIVETRLAESSIPAEGK